MTALTLFVISVSRCRRDTLKVFLYDTRNTPFHIHKSNRHKLVLLKHLSKHSSVPNPLLVHKSFVGTNNCTVLHTSVNDFPPCGLVNKIQIMQRSLWWVRVYSQPSWHVDRWTSWYDVSRSARAQVCLSASVRGKESVYCHIFYYNLIILNSLNN